MPFPNEGLLWHRDNDNGPYHKRIVKIGNDDTLVIKQPGAKVFDGKISIKIADALIQIVPAPNGDNSPVRRTSNSPTRATTRQCYFRIVNKGKPIHLRSRNQQERDVWVQILLAMKSAATNREQREDETYPLGRPPEDVEEHGIVRTGSFSATYGDESPLGMTARSAALGKDPDLLSAKGINSPPPEAVVAAETEAQSPPGNQEGGTAVFSQSIAEEVASAGSSETFSDFSFSDSDKAEDSVLIETTGKKQGEAGEWEPKQVNPTSDINRVPTLVIDAPSDDEGLTSPLRSRQMSAKDFRTETRGFLARVHEMLSYGTMRMPPRKEHTSVETTFAKGVLGEAATHAHTGLGQSSRVRSALANARRDGILCTLMHSPTTKAEPMRGVVHFDETSAVVQTSSQDIAINIPCGAIESMLPLQPKDLLRTLESSYSDPAVLAIHQMDVTYWWDPRCLTNTKHSATLPEMEGASLLGSKHSYRVRLGFATATDLRTCLKLLDERRVAVRNALDQAEDDQHHSSQSTDDPAMSGSLSGAPHSPTQTASSASFSAATMGIHFKHRVGAERSALLQRPSFGVSEQALDGNVSLYQSWKQSAALRKEQQEAYQAELNNVWADHTTHSSVQHFLAAFKGFY